MANFEEKILAYLDGSLSEADRENVLDGISGEHARSDERELFNAHLRLQNIYSVVRAPVSAPLSVQRELAAQIPVLAIKLPYLAAQEERRDKFAAGWLSSIRSSWINVFLLLTLLLLAGGVWYVVNDNTNRTLTGTADGSSSTSRSTIANSSSITNATNGGASVGGTSTSRVTNATAGNTPQNISSSNASPAGTSTLHTSVSHSTVHPSVVKASNADVSGTSSNHSPNALHKAPMNYANGSNSHSNTIPAKASNNMHAAGTGTGHSKGSSSNSTSNSNNTIADRNVNGFANSNAASSTNAASSVNETQKKNSTVTPAEDINSNANTSSPTNPSINGNSAKPAEPELPPLPLHSINALEMPIGFDPQHTMPIGYQAQDNSSSFVPFRVFASPGYRLLMPSPNQNKYVLNDSKQGLSGNTFVQSYEAGVEYEINPWTSAGIHIGQTSFAQYQAITHPGSSPGLSTQYLDYEVSPISSVWSALALTQTFNPQDRARFSLTVAGGPAFTTPSIALLGMIEPNVTYDLSSTFMLRGGISYDIARVQQSAQSTSTSSNSTAGIIIASSGGTLVSNAIGFNVGISFHP
jgi:hypothetical protein